MNHPTSTPSDSFLRNPPDFSLVHGGPLFQFLLRAHLSDDALELARQRILVIALLAWLLLLSALEDNLLGGNVAVPFLMDAEVHIKFLLAITLMVGAELVVHRRMRLLVKQFLDRKLACRGEVDGPAQIRHPGPALRARVRYQMAARRNACRRAIRGSADIQSLADMGNSFEVVPTMKVAPVSKEAILRLATAVVVCRCCSP